jgi:hypothetical protein
MNNRPRKPWDREIQNRKKLAERRARRGPVIYFFRCRGFIKIGWTTDINQRLASIQTCNPDPVSLAAVIQGGDKQESALHRAFRQHYHRGEWFREEGQLAELIALVVDLPADEARVIAGDWFLATFGKLTLLSYALSHKNLIMDDGLACKHEAVQ